MAGLTVEYRDEGLCAASWSSVVVFIWSGPITVKRVEAAAQVRGRALSQTEGLGSVLHVHIARRVPRPDEAVRRRAEDNMAHFAAGTIGQAHVLSAAGFTASAMRRLIEGSRSEAPLHIGANVDDAIDWLVQLEDQDPILEVYRDKLVEDVRALVADVTASLTAA